MKSGFVPNRLKMFFKSLREEVLGPCNNPCGSCGEWLHCLNKKNAMNPLPIVAWSCLGLATAIPLALSLNPKSWASIYAGKNAEWMDREDVEFCFGDLMEKMELRHPERIEVMITDGVGPTSLGVDGPRGGVVLLPMELFVLMNPDTRVAFEGVFEGRVGDMTDEQRTTLLDQGFLVPTQRHLQFIMGHEFSHLVHRHVWETSKIAVLTALLTHFALKVNNAVAFHSQRFRFMEIKSVPVYAALVMGVALAVVSALAWDQELQADVSSAARLKLHTDAVQLKEFQVRQLAALKRNGLRMEGIDLEHPPAELQLLNLKWLRDKVTSKSN